MKTSLKDLYDFLKGELSEGKIDFSFRATETESGIDLVIHPDQDGKTLDLTIIDYSGDGENLDLATNF